MRRMFRRDRRKGFAKNIPPILQEAGGYFGAWDGKPTIYANEALGTTQTLLPEVLATIEGEHD